METVPASDRVRATLHQYVADVLALESNIEEALDDRRVGAAAQSLTRVWRAGHPEDTKRAA